MGRELLVNTYQKNWQFNPDIVTFADGSFLVTWDSYFDNQAQSEPVLTYVAGQRYSADGRRVGGEIVMDGVDGCVSENASVTKLADGGYVMVCVFDNDGPIRTDGTKVYATVYNADGSERRASYRVDTVPSNDAIAPEVVALGNGGFRIAYGVDRLSGNFDDVYARIYNRMGQPIGADTLLNPNQRHFEQGTPESAMLRNGTTITIWRSEASFDRGTDLDANEIRGTLTDANGHVIRSDFSLGQAQGTITQFGNSSGLAYDLTGLAQGGFVVSHVFDADDLGVVAPQYSDSVVVRFFNNAGNLTVRDQVVFTTKEIVFATAVAQLVTGDIVVVWEQYDANDKEEVDRGTDIMGRVLSSSGHPISSTFEIGVDYFAGDDQANPVVRALAGGGFVVAYESDSIDSDDEGIAARIYGRATAGNDRVSVDVSGMMLGLGGNDTITGNGRSNLLAGDAGTDRLSGLAGDDRLGGGAGRDVLLGGDGRDRLSGGLGMDTLTGGAGADSFIFANVANPGNRDTITAFASVDVILLDNAVFRALGAVGTLAPGLFKMIGTGANADANDRVIYDKRTGVLYYDTNGSADGGRFAIADLDNRPILTAGDIHII
jgi:Ca2+-binding RTX toxin-like protein